jgi:hypothetical protein
VRFEQHDVLVDGSIQSQLTNQLVQGADASAPYGARSLGNLKVNVRILEHAIRLVGILLPFQSGFKILLVSEVYFIISFVHLECAPFCRSGYSQFPITINNKACSRLFFLLRAKITLV